MDACRENTDVRWVGLHPLIIFDRSGKFLGGTRFFNSF